MNGSVREPTPLERAIQRMRMLLGRKPGPVRWIRTARGWQADISVAYVVRGGR